MFIKRLVNSVITIPVLFVISAVLIVASAYLGHYLDYFEATHQPIGVGAVAFLMGAAMLDCLMFLGAVFISTGAVAVLITGHGLLWRRVDEHDFLQNPDGSVFRRFEKADLIWRWSPIFNGRKLMGYSDF
jgi:hypothetical protein